MIHSTVRVVLLARAASRARLVGLPVARPEITFPIMGIRAQVALCASLALVVPQFVRLESAHVPEYGVTQAEVRLQLHSQPHPESEGARTRLPNDGLDLHEATAFAPAGTANRSLPWVYIRAPLAPSPEARPSALVTLPFSRASPTLS